ncbi:MAG TPA: mechanosensitive ion channel [Candidatus Omnitrophota bacterium]|nr:mechanosensitive ion channel [Candidatus Omnitrophota bacterium]HQQ06405.1 mechanosensitive ion channel [Candidatus Omnitrophota bacterium]
MQEMWDKFSVYALDYGLRLVYAILILIIGKWIARIVTNLVEKAMVKGKLDQTLASFTKSLAFIGLMAFVIVAALNKLGIETTSFIAIIGAAGLAVGLALQGSLANFAAGVMLIIFKPFKVGDFVEVAGKLGTVVEIQMFNTIMDQPDNRRMIVPNSKVTGDIVTNFSDLKMRRVDLVFGISYGDDMKKAKDALEKVCSEDPRILKDPKPTVAVSELADSSVNLVCRPYVKPADYWGVYFDTVEKGKTALEKAGCTIPFPQRDVHMYQAK